MEGLKPSNPEDWILFAQTKLEAASANIVRGLADVTPDLLEFLMSANDRIYSAVRSSVCGPAFPTTHALWPNSISSYFLQRFLAYLNRLPSHLGLVDYTIDEACRRVVPYTVLLSILSRVQLAVIDEELKIQERKECVAGIVAPAGRNTHAVDPRLFSSIGLEYPTTTRKFHEVEAEVLRRLHALLEVLLSAFKGPKLKAYSKSLVFGSPLQHSTPFIIIGQGREPNDTILTRHGIFHGPDDSIPQPGRRPGSNASPGFESTARELVSMGSPTEPDWETTGRKLFGKRLYLEATICFEKANLPVEGGIATAYESRKQAMLLQVSQSVNQTACCAAFTKAAEEFLACAGLSRSEQQLSCFIAAAECYFRAKDWAAAAKAYCSGNDFDMAAKIFHNTGNIDEAVGVIKKHRNDVQKATAEQIIGIARLEYFRTNQIEKASDLFDEVEEQLEYIEDYGFTQARIRVLECHKCHDQVREAVEEALGRLWKLLPFGALGDRRDNPAIDSIIGLLSSSKTLSDEESLELEAFRAVQSDKIEQLLDLTQSSHNAASDSEQQTAPCYSILALLCFSYSSHLLIPHRNSRIPEFIQKAKLVLNYINQMLQFSQDFDISSLDAQKLLAFEPARSTKEEEGQSKPLEYRIYSTSLMFEGAKKALGSVAPSCSVPGLPFLTVTESETHRLALAVMHDMIRSEVRKMHRAVDLGCFLYPCLDFAISGRCNRPECGRQEVETCGLPSKERQELFNQRTRAMMLQIQIVNSYQVHNYQNRLELRDFRRIWTHRLYESLMPYFPPPGSLLCVGPQLIPELTNNIDAISALWENTLCDLDPGFGVPNKFLSDVLANLDVSFRTHRPGYISVLHTTNLVRPRDDLMIESSGSVPEKYSIVHDLINFYERKSLDAISRVIRAISHIVFKPLAIEANVLVNMLEFIGREIIAHWRLYQRGSDGVFHELLLPRSWAFDLVKQPPLPLQQGVSVRDYLNILYKVLELLRGYEPNSSLLYGFNSQLGLLVRAVMITRICRLIVLVAHNTSVTLVAKEEIRQRIVHSLTGPGDVHTALCGKFLRADSWNRLWNAVRSSLLNRGADELVYLFRRQDGHKPPIIAAVRSIVFSKVNPELEQLLSLLEPDSLESITASEQPTPSGFTNPNTSRVESKCPLTALEIESGRKILFGYRRHAQRQRTKKAVQTIWACYLRHRLRCKYPMTATEEQIYKLHKEYKNDTEFIECPIMDVKAFRRHERILLGFMPHVMVYLRGLEPVYQQQKEVNKERLKMSTYAELDIIRVRMDTCVTSAKKIKELTRRIAPGSPVLHQFATLREAIKQVHSLRAEIMHIFGGDAIPVTLEEHYERGISVMLFPPTQA